MFSVVDESSSKTLERMLGASTTFNFIKLSSTRRRCFSSAMLDFVSMLEVSFSSSSSTSIYEL